jgi:hypothetical protein
MDLIGGRERGPYLDQLFAILHAFVEGHSRQRRRQVRAHLQPDAAMVAGRETAKDLLGTPSERALRSQHAKSHRLQNFVTSHSAILPIP